MFSTPKKRTCRVFRSHLLRGHDCGKTIVDHKFKLNWIAWRQRVGYPTTDADCVCVGNLSAYGRIEILESNDTQDEAKNQQFQQGLEQYGSTQTSDSFRSQWVDEFLC